MYGNIRKKKKRKDKKKVNDNNGNSNKAATATAAVSRIIDKKIERWTNTFDCVETHTVTHTQASAILVQRKKSHKSTCFSKVECRVFRASVLYIFPIQYLPICFCYLFQFCLPQLFILQSALVFLFYMGLPHSFISYIVVNSNFMPSATIAKVASLLTHLLRLWSIVCMEILLTVVTDQHVVKWSTLDRCTQRMNICLTIIITACVTNK